MFNIAKERELQLRLRAINDRVAFFLSESKYMNSLTKIFRNTKTKIVGTDSLKVISFSCRKRWN